ncbi:AF4/FMR2 family member 1-like [Strix uralensis]|uniref:AF4/FMR2 family member 1-like n=1 Tax=Strix uralensis TaxID=36305 RepID=UPI003DA74AEF
MTSTLGSYHKALGREVQQLVTTQFTLNHQDPHALDSPHGAEPGLLHKHETALGEAPETNPLTCFSTADQKKSPCPARHLSHTAEVHQRTLVMTVKNMKEFIMTLKSFTDSTASSQDKIFAVLCMRCQSLLHMAMFRYKKDTALKYSRILNEHFKSSSRSTQAPSPCVARSTGMTYAGSYSRNSNGSAVTVPYNIPNITSAYVNITSHILYACDIWEKADALAGKNTEFFAELSTATCALALNSSVPEVVCYARQGLQWLRRETATP